MSNMVYTLLPLPSKREIRNMIKSIKITNVKDIKNDLLKPNDIYAKKKNVYKKKDKQKPSKGNCFNYGKYGHFSKDCKKWVVCLWLSLLISPTVILTMLKLLIFLLSVFLGPFAVGGKNILPKSLENPSKRLLKKMMMNYPFLMKELVKVFLMESIL